MLTVEEYNENKKHESNEESDSFENEFENENERCQYRDQICQEIRNIQDSKNSQEIRETIQSAIHAWNHFRDFEDDNDSIDKVEPQEQEQVNVDSLVLDRPDHFGDEITGEPSSILFYPLQHSNTRVGDKYFFSVGKPIHPKYYIFGLVCNRWIPDSEYQSIMNMIIDIGIHNYDIENTFRDSMMNQFSDDQLDSLMCYLGDWEIFNPSLLSVQRFVQGFRYNNTFIRGVDPNHATHNLGFHGQKALELLLNASHMADQQIINEQQVQNEQQIFIEQKDSKKTYDISQILPIITYLVENGWDVAGYTINQGMCVWKSPLINAGHSPLLLAHLLSFVDFKTLDNYKQKWVQLLWSIDQSLPQNITEFLNILFDLVPEIEFSENEIDISSELSRFLDSMFHYYLYFIKCPMNYVGQENRFSFFNGRDFVTLVAMLVHHGASLSMERLNQINQVSLETRNEFTNELLDVLDSKRDIRIPERKERTDNA